MFIKIDDKNILEITPVMLKILANEILTPELMEDIERRIAWSITNKCDMCFSRLKAEWDPKLSDRGIEMIPTNKEKYAELVFSQPDYKSRSEREGVSEREVYVDSNKS